MKVALVAPSGTVIDVGMVTWAALTISPRANETALVGAAVKVTVQLAVPGVINVWGLHTRVDSSTTFSAVPRPLAPRAIPVSDEADAPVIPMDNDPVALADTLKLAVAITPLGIADVFRPHKMHSVPLATVVHEIDLPAATTAGDATKLRPLSTELGYVSVHSKLAGAFPEVVTKEIFVEPGSPATADAEPTCTVTWARQRLFIMKRHDAPVIRRLSPRRNRIDLFVSWDSLPIEMP